MKSGRDSTAVFRNEEDNYLLMQLMACVPIVPVTRYFLIAVAVSSHGLWACSLTSVGT
jgi:hypothetical protein